MLEIVLLLSMALNLFQHSVIKRQRNFTKAAKALVSRR
jgi:hypothetical protein